ncbi:hypothetical protein D3C86_2083060 [compost metagenome]
MSSPPRSTAELAMVAVAVALTPAQVNTAPVTAAEEAPEVCTGAVAVDFPAVVTV